MTATASTKKGAKKAADKAAQPKPKEKENWMLKYAGILTEEEAQGLAAHISAMRGRPFDIGPAPKNPVRGELARKRFKIKQ